MAVKSSLLNYGFLSSGLVLLCLLTFLLAAVVRSGGRVEVNVNDVSLDVEFHDREDLVYERQRLQLRYRNFCSELMNVCAPGGEFLHE